jgi:hypothetical protein
MSAKLLGKLISKTTRKSEMTDATYHLNGGFKPTMKRFADLNGPDFFPTPPWATFALIENEKFGGEIWECACGDGIPAWRKSRDAAMSAFARTADSSRTSRHVRFVP